MVSLIRLLLVIMAMFGMGTVPGSLRFVEAVSAPRTGISALAADNYIREKIYKGCWETKGCVGSPDDRSIECIKRRTCRALITHAPASETSLRNDYFKIEMFGRISRTRPTGYVALGISADEYMGHDGVVACFINEIGETGVHMYWNTEVYPQTSRHFPTITCDYGSRPNSYLAKCAVDVYVIPTGRFVLCRFYMKKYIELEGEIFDTGTLAYFILTAIGFKAHSTSGIGFHAEAFRTSTKVELSSHNQAYPNNLALVRSHASLMILVYFVVLPNSALLARYFKETAIHYPVFNRRMYHFVHMVCSLWAVGMSLVAHWNIWNVSSYYNFSEPHLPPDNNQLWHLFGGSGATLLLIIIVILSSCCPCGPRRHPVFSYFHWFLGYSAYFFGLAIIMTSHRLKASLFPCESGIFVIISVVWALFWNLVLTRHHRAVEVLMLGNPTTRTRLPLPLPRISSAEAPMPGPRIMYLFLHCIGSLILATIVIIILLSSTSPCYCTKFICLSSEDPVLQLPEIRV